MYPIFFIKILILFFLFQNSQFAIALQSRVTDIYRNSWIFQYYNFSLKTIDNVICFNDTILKDTVNSYRFNISLFITPSNRLYFGTNSDWNLMLPGNTGNNNTVIKTDIISNVPHGFKYESIPATKSLLYTAPFLFKLKTHTKLPSNYLVFNGFFKYNLDQCILAMVRYDDFTYAFVSEFSPTIVIPFSNTLSLNNSLEFILVDSNDKQVAIENNSQLFLSITIKQ